MPQTLFSAPHPKRSLVNGVWPSATEAQLLSPGFARLEGGQAHSRCLFDATDDHVLIGILDRSGSVSNFRVDFRSPVVSKSLPSIEDLTASDVVLVKRGFAIINKFSGIGTRYTAAGRQSLAVPIRSPSLFASDGNILAVGNALGDYVWWNGGSEPHSLSFILHRVACFAVSETFGIFAFGAVHGMVYISDLASHQISFACDLKGKVPKRMLISEGLGFILVNCDDGSLMLFNVNGYFIRETMPKKDIVVWKAFKNRNGIDYLIIGDQNGNLRICELFYLNFSRVIFRPRSSVLLLEYDSGTGNFIIITADHRLFRFTADSIFRRGQ
jgi:hypothetical protein